MLPPSEVYCPHTLAGSSWHFSSWFASAPRHPLNDHNTTQDSFVIISNGISECAYVQKMTLYFIRIVDPADALYDGYSINGAPDQEMTVKNLQLGQGMTEYIIIVALVAIAAMGTFRFFGQTARQQVAAMSQELAGKDGRPRIEAAGLASNLAQRKAGDYKLNTYAGQNSNEGGSSD